MIAFAIIQAARVPFTESALQSTVWAVLGYWHLKQVVKSLIVSVDGERSRTLCARFFHTKNKEVIRVLLPDFVDSISISLKAKYV